MRTKMYIVSSVDSNGDIVDSVELLGLSEKWEQELIRFAESQNHTKIRLSIREVERTTLTTSETDYDLIFSDMATENEEIF